MPKISDGIVSSKVFKKEKIKLLWILKEANDKKGKDNWDLREFLRWIGNEKKRESCYNKWKATWGLVCKVSWGILDSTKQYEEINHFDDNMLTQVLYRIAVINVKKVSGGSSVNQKEFKEYIKDGKYLKELKKQIKNISPNIIICGNTFHYMHHPRLSNFNYYKEWCFIENGIKWINVYHPNQKSNSHKQYFDEAINAIG